MREVIKDFKEKPTMSLHGFLGAKEMDIQFEEFLRNALEKDHSKPKEAPTHVIIVWSANYWYAEYCKQNYTTKVVDELIFPMKHEIFTYENKVIILMYHSTELSGIMIESESLAQGIRSMFELVWKYAPETTEKI